MKRVYVIHAWTVFFLLAILNPVQGASPWQWEATLQMTSQQGGVMHLPVGLYADEESQRYYVVDGGNNRILAFERSGEFISSFTASNSLLKPYALVREPGFLWIVEKDRNTLTEIDLQKRKVLPEKVKDGDSLLYPDRIAKEGDTLFVLDRASGRIYILDKDLAPTASFGCSDCPGGFVDFKVKNSMIWALAQQSSEVHLFTLDGKSLKKIGLEGGDQEFPRSLAVDDSENLYILDRHAGRVGVFDRSGVFKYTFLEPGHTRGQLYYPVKLQFDPWGRLCVVDEGNGRVQIYSRR